MIISINECPAGPTLDAAVAEVLGWERCPGEYIDHWIPPGFDMPVVRNWSDDIAAAWDLAEEMVQDGHDFYVDNYRTREGSGWDANYRNSSQPQWKTVSAEKAPLAITRAFLLAHGVTEVEIPE